MASETKSPASEIQPHKRFLPPLWYWLLVAILIAINAWYRLPEPPDHAIANVIAMGSVAVAVISLLVWFAVFSRQSRPVRWTPPVVIVGAIVVFFVFFRLEGTTAELIPIFAPRFRPELPVAQSPSASVPLGVSTDNDFPQFLGPRRDLAIDRITLARDWRAHPPKLLWKHEIGSGHSAFSAVNGYAVTMEQRGEQELVTCYVVETGALQWSSGVHARHSVLPGGTGPRSTPTIYEGKVYALGATGILRCLEGTNGSLIWTKNILEETGVTPEDDGKQVLWGHAGSPLIVDNLVVVPGGGPSAGPKFSLLAFDRETGKKMWQAGDRQVSYSSPSLVRLGGVRQIVIVNENNVSGHNAATGAVLWEYPWPGSSNSSASTSQAIAVGDDRVFVSKGYGEGSALFNVKHDAATDRWTTETIWRHSRNLQTKMTNVVIHKGLVYGLSDGILECVELANGERQWKSGRYHHGQILRVGELLLVETEDGEIVLVELTPEAHRELGRFEAIEGKSWNNLCLYGRYLLVRNSNEAACYELPLARE
jgi:outer membrane protein assembly factor BamB